MRGKSHGFSQVAAGTWGFLSSYDGDGHSKRVFVQRHQDSCLVVRDNSGFSSRLDRAIRMPLDVRLETQCPFPVATELLASLPIFMICFRGMELRIPLELSKGYEASCRDEAGN